MSVSGDDRHAQLDAVLGAEAGDRLTLPGERRRVTASEIRRRFNIWLAHQAVDPLAEPQVMIAVCMRGHEYLVGALMRLPSGGVSFVPNESSLRSIGASNGAPAGNWAEMMAATTRWRLPCPHCDYAPTVYLEKVTARAMHACMRGQAHFALLD